MSLSKSECGSLGGRPRNRTWDELNIDERRSQSAKQTLPELRELAHQMQSERTNFIEEANRR